jgi:hypothetical protein
VTYSLAKVFGKQLWIVGWQCGNQLRQKLLALLQYIAKVEARGLDGVCEDCHQQVLLRVGCSQRALVVGGVVRGFDVLNLAQPDFDVLAMSVEYMNMMQRHSIGWALQATVGNILLLAAGIALQQQTLLVFGSVDEVGTDHMRSKRATGDPKTEQQSGTEARLVVVVAVAEVFTTVSDTYANVGKKDDTKVW